VQTATTDFHLECYGITNKIRVDTNFVNDAITFEMKLRIKINLECSKSRTQSLNWKS